MTDDIKLLLGQLDGKVDMILAGQTVQRQTLEAHDGRIGTLEKWQARVLGGAAVAGFVSGILVKVLL